MSFQPTQLGRDNIRLQCHLPQGETGVEAGFAENLVKRCSHATTMVIATDGVKTIITILAIIAYWTARGAAPNTEIDVITGFC